MKFLTVCVLGWAMMALARAAAVQEAEAESDQSESTDLVKRTWYCPRGWTWIRGSCFKYVSCPMTWSRAERNCRRLGGHLASVQSIGEYRAIQRMIKCAGHGYRAAWLGATNARHKCYWRWTNGEAFRFSRWCGGEPNNYAGRQHCLQMNHSGRKCWDDLECYAYRPSVCKRRRCWG